MIYLSVIGDDFGFKDDTDEQIEILPTDILMLHEVYTEYLEQNQTKDFKVKNANGETFERIFEEIIPIIVVPTEEKTPFTELQDTMDTILMSLL